MPTAADYRDAARRLRTQAAWIHEASVTVPDGAEAFGGVGPIADHHAESMRALRSHLRRAVTEFAELAGICDRRAAVCAAYADEIHRYEQLDWWQRLMHARPARPAAWVEA